MFENYNHQYQQNDLKKDGFQNKIIIFVFFVIIAIIAILVCCIFLLKQEAFDKSVDAKINSTINFLKSELNKNKKSEDEILNGLFNAINKKAQLNQNNQENVMFKPIDKKKLIGFDKLIGFKDEKDASDRFIKSFKADIDNSDLGETNPPIGMLLYGVAGTGKTTLARALAKEVDVPFFEVSSSTFSCKYKGEGVTKVEKLFESAREEANKSNGAIIFLDECETIFQDLTKLETESEINNIVNQLKSEMTSNKNDPKKPIFIIGATNHYNKIDSAIKSRFNYKIEMFPANKEDPTKNV